MIKCENMLISTFLKLKLLMLAVSIEYIICLGAC